MSFLLASGRSSSRRRRIRGSWIVGTAIIVAAWIGAGSDSKTTPGDVEVEDQEHVGGDEFDLTGEWVLTNTTESTSYKPFKGLQLGYRVFIQQNGNRIEGNGEKCWENGETIPAGSRTSISLIGTVSLRDVFASCREKGRRRDTACAFEWRVLPSNAELVGTFTSTAARSSGSSVATRASGWLGED